MKTVSILSVSLLLLFSFSCKKNEPPENQFSARDVYYGECKSTTKIAFDEHILLYFHNENYLAVSHNNAMFNCSPGQIIVDAKIEGRNIIVDEYETDSSSNCICPYDISYNIGPLPYESYTFIFQRGGYEVLREEIIFDSEIDIRIDLVLH
jgi:hypothetical protein